MKKIAKAFICTFLMLALLSVSVGAEGGYVSTTQFRVEVNGDVNGDGRISSLDAATILRYDADLLDEFENKAEAPELTAEAGERLISDYCTFKGVNNPEMPITIEKYYGNYNGWEAVLFEEATGEAYRTVDVAGYFFCYYSFTEIKLCKGTEFYDLSVAYENGIISKDEVFGIGMIHGVIPTDLYESGNYDIPAPDHLFPTVVKRHYGDVNGDRRISSLDAALVLRYDADLLDAE